MWNYILFDLDGTLTDSVSGITNSVDYALRKFGIEVADKADLKKFIGPPLIPSFREFYGLSLEDATQAVVYYREYYEEKGLFDNRVYDGVTDMLNALKSAGKCLIVATSKPELYARAILEHFELAPYFDCIAGATMDEKCNQKSAVIRMGLDRLGVTDISEAVMVGDRKHDIEGARINQLSSIGVLYGYGSREELLDAGADHLAETPEEVVRICLK